VDISIPPQQADIQLHNWLRYHDRPYLVIATKADRISNNQLQKSLASLSRELDVEPAAIIPFSSKSRTGHAAVWNAILQFAGIR